MPSLLDPISGTPYVGGASDGDLSVVDGLQYVRQNNLAAVTAPTVNADASAGYVVGSTWINVAAGSIYSCVDSTNGAAVWKNLGGSGSPAGVGTEIQYRNGTSFGAITNSSYAGNVVTLPNLVISDLTATRIPYAGTAGRLVDSPYLTFSSTPSWFNIGGVLNTTGLEFSYQGAVAYIVNRSGPLRLYADGLRTLDITSSGGTVLYYDITNYFSTTVASNGSVTLESISAAVTPGFTFGPTGVSVGIGTTNTNAVLNIVGDGVTNSGIPRHGIRSVISDQNNNSAAGYFDCGTANAAFAILVEQGPVTFGRSGISNTTINGRILCSGLPSALYAHVYIGDNTSGFSAGQGGTIAFGGDERGAGYTVSTFASIGGVKENGSYLNSLGALVFGTQSNSGGAQQLATVTEKMRITSGGFVGVLTTAPDKQVEINSVSGGCLRLTHNDSNGSATYYGDFDISGAGALTITPSHGVMNLAAKVKPTSSYQTLVIDSVSAGTITFNMNASNYHYVVLDGNHTLAVSDVATGQAFTLVLVQDGVGTRIPTWFTTIKWSTGTVPTLATAAGKIDVFTFLKINSTDYLGSHAIRGA